jgi:hypothetical protein
MEMKFKINYILHKHLEINFKKFTKDARQGELNHKLERLYVTPLNFTLRERHMHASFLVKVEEIYLHLCHLAKK